MDLTIVLQLITLLALGGIILFKKYVFSYSSEKGKNLATKEDIEIITRKVESTKIEYVAEIERLKVELALHSRKNDILFDEKIRVFKKLQETLVGFKKYCEAAIGTYGDGGEFQPTLETLDENIDRPALKHIDALHEIQFKDFIFLSEHSNLVLHNLYQECAMVASTELQLLGNEQDRGSKMQAVPLYEKIIIDIDKCLQSLYEELKFPSETH